MIKKILLTTGSIALAAFSYRGNVVGASAAEEKAVRLPAPAMDVPASAQPVP